MAAEYEITAEVRADVQAFVASLSERGALAVG